MHNLCVFCTFATFAQKIFKGWGSNFTWSFGKVMRSKSMKMVFVSRINRHKLCMIYAFFDFLCSKTIFDQKYSLTAEIYLTTWGPLYTCLVEHGINSIHMTFYVHSYYVAVFPVKTVTSQNTTWSNPLCTSWEDRTNALMFSRHFRYLHNLFQQPKYLRYYRV